MKSHSQFLSGAIWSLAVACAAFLPAAVLAADVSVSIQPSTFGADQGAKLSVTVNGGSSDQPINPPIPDGVSLRPYGKSSNIQIINGSMTRSEAQNFVVTADKEGEYTIPSFEVSVNGETIQTDPVTFTVTAGGSAPQSLPGGSSAAPQGNAPAADSQSLGFLEMQFPARDREHLYVGEMAPVRITAFFPPRTRVQLTSQPRPEGPGFTLHNLSEEPEQQLVEKDGETYRAVTWYGGISVAKAGEYPVKVSLDATVMVRDQSGGRSARPRSPFGGSFFNDPFFDDFFDNAFTRVIPREVTLSSKGDPLEVRSLPTEGRPADFSGAVGKFSFGGFKLPADATTGEPQRVRVTVKGKGNFDRMSAPVLEPGDSWKTYAPKTEFQGDDVAAFSGSKTFEFSAVPRKGGEQRVKLTTSYFDPDTGKYETIASPEVPLDIAGEDLSSGANTMAAAALDPKQEKSSQKAKAPTQLAPLREIGVISSASLQPLLYHPAFQISVGLGILGIVAGFVIGGLRQRHSEPSRVAARAAQQREREAIEAAAESSKSGDASVFFDSARRALQVRLGSIWDKPAEAITLSEVRQRFDGDTAIVQFFSKADAVSYAPAGSISTTELDRWNRLLQETLANPSYSVKRPDTVPSNAS
ncbi:MAG: hypothetical protein CMO55_06530 [Verrucomicrobiales bacterium]|nr:hypothetical protein [Verrucomicrobiales bacterium]